MEMLSLYLYISIALPLLTVSVVTRERARTVTLFLLFGVTAGLFCGEVNGLLIGMVNLQTRFYTVDVAPIVEELVKAFPLIVYAYTEKPSRQRLLEAAVVMGVGFAILENAFILAKNIGTISLLLAFTRGIGTGLMHAVCTFAVGFGLSFIVSEKRLAISGTLGLLGAAIIYHSFYNNMIQSDYAFLAFILPLCTFTLLVLRLRKR